MKIKKRCKNDKRRDQELVSCELTLISMNNRMFEYNHEIAVERFNRRYSETRQRLKTLKYLKELEQDMFKRAWLSLEIIEFELQELSEEFWGIVDQLNRF